MTKQKGNTRSAKIRAWLDANGPATFAEILAGTGFTRPQMKATIYQMVDNGLIVGDDQAPRAYSIGRAPQLVWGQVKPRSHKNAYNATRRRKGTRTQAQIIADAAAKREEAHRLRKLADDIRVARQDREANERREARRQDVKRMSDALSSPTANDDRPCTITFIAENPQHYHRLAPQEVSPAARFKRIGG